MQIDLLKQIPTVKATTTEYFPRWYQCPECGHEGTENDLESFGHFCCREYIKELEEAIEKLKTV
jgi:hypothetical protein